MGRGREYRHTVGDKAWGGHVTPGQKVGNHESGDGMAKEKGDATLGG